MHARELLFLRGIRGLSFGKESNQTRHVMADITTLLRGLPPCKPISGRYLVLLAILLRGYRYVMLTLQFELPGMLCIELKGG
jgi:hypothetical protein